MDSRKKKESQWPHAESEVLYFEAYLCGACESKYAIIENFKRQLDNKWLATIYCEDCDSREKYKIDEDSLMAFALLEGEMQ